MKLKFTILLHVVQLQTDQLPLKSAILVIELTKDVGRQADLFTRLGACATSMPIPAEKNNKQNPMKNHKPLKEYPNMVTFPIPGQGTAREGLTVKLKCPVKNFDRSKNRWLKNGQTIKDDGT